MGLVCEVTFRLRYYLLYVGSNVITFLNWTPNLYLGDMNTHTHILRLIISIIGRFCIYDHLERKESSFWPLTNFGFRIWNLKGKSSWFTRSYHMRQVSSQSNGRICPWTWEVPTMRTRLVHRELLEGSGHMYPGFLWNQGHVMTPAVFIMWLPRSCKPALPRRWIKSLEIKGHKIPRANYNQPMRSRSSRNYHEPDDSIIQDCGEEEEEEHLQNWSSPRSWNSLNQARALSFVPGQAKSGQQKLVTQMMTNNWSTCRPNVSWTEKQKIRWSLLKK